MHAKPQPKGSEAEVERLRELAATCYAGLGAECDLPEQWLDVLNAAANGELFTTDGLLPFTATQAPAPAHESKGDEPLRDVAQRALEVLAFVGDWDHRGESVAEAWNAHATAADGWNALLQDLEAALSQPAAHPIWLGMRESVLCEAANAVGEQMKRWPTDDRAVYVAAECAAAVRALIANPQAKGPVKVWCETCNGSGEVHQEHQAGCWVGGSHACPDCDGKGYSERATQAPAVGDDGDDEDETDRQLDEAWSENEALKEELAELRAASPVRRQDVEMAAALMDEAANLLEAVGPETLEKLPGYRWPMADELVGAAGIMRDYLGGESKPPVQGGES